ncbi:hypothetical protein D3C86_1706350 [compost metagenome]
MHAGKGHGFSRNIAARRDRAVVREQTVSRAVQQRRSPPQQTLANAQLALAQGLQQITLGQAIRLRVRHPLRPLVVIQRQARFEYQARALAGAPVALQLQIEAQLSGAAVGRAATQGGKDVLMLANQLQGQFVLHAPGARVVADDAVERRALAACNAGDEQRRDQTGYQSRTRDAHGAFSGFWGCGWACRTAL